MSEGWRITVVDDGRIRVFLARIADLESARSWVMEMVPDASDVRVDPLAGGFGKYNLLDGQIIESTEAGT
jgi:hypothetical protein